MKQVFYSKKDWWVVGVVIATTGLLAQLLWTMSQNGAMQGYPEHTFIYILTIIILWWPVLTTRYIVINNELIIKSMFYTLNIPCKNIVNISPSNNLTAAPALSLDRLKIEYKKEGKIRSVLISPRKKVQFYQALNVDVPAHLK